VLVVEAVPRRRSAAHSTQQFTLRVLMHLNNDVKANVHRRAMPRTKDELKNNVKVHLKKITRSPQRVRSYFQAKHIQYAA
jgi:hypothetical protein